MLRSAELWGVVPLNCLSLGAGSLIRLAAACTDRQLLEYGVLRRPVAGGTPGAARTKDASYRVQEVKRALRGVPFWASDMAAYQATQTAADAAALGGSPSDSWWEGLFSPAMGKSLAAFDV